MHKKEQNNQVGGEDETVTAETNVDNISVEDVLNFDPFGPEASNELNADGGSVAPVEEDNGAVNNEDGGASGTSADINQQEGEADAQPSGDDPASPSADPEGALVKTQLAEAMKALEDMKKQNEALVAQQQQAQTASTNQPAQGEQPQDDTPQYLFDIPDQLMGMINSEDQTEAKQGLTTLVAGVSRTVHKQVLDQVQQVIGPQILQMAQQGNVQHIQQTEEMNNIRTDFYGRYKEFDREDLKPIVVQVAKNMVTELGIPKYTPEFGDALAQRLKTMFGSVNPAQNMQQPVVNQPKINQGSVTRTPVKTTDSQQDQMMELLT